MAVRGLAFLLAVAMVAVTVPPGAAQGPALPDLPAVGSDHIVYELEVPWAGSSGSGSLQVPLDGGVLDVAVVPLALDGPGGSVDVGAYLAQARMLLPDGTILPLPSMVIRSQAQGAQGPTAGDLDDLAARITELRAALDDAAAAVPDTPSDSADDGGSDPQDPATPGMPAEVEELRRQADELAAQAAWIQAFADAAASAVGAGAAEQAAIAHSMLTRVEAGLTFLESGLELLKAQAEAAAAGLPLPEREVPAADPPASSSPTNEPEPPAAPAMPEMPDLSPLHAAIADAQARLDEAKAAADEAHAALVAAGMEAVLSLQAMADESLIEAQAALDGARAAAQAVQDDLDERRQKREEAAEARLAALEASLADRSAQGQAKADDAARDAQARLEAAAAELQWARDWVAEAQALAPALAQGSLDDAQRSLASAQATVEAVLALLRSHSGADGMEESLAPEIDQAQRDVDAASAEAAAAQQDIEDALAALGHVAGGLDPLALLPPMPGIPSAPTAPEIPEAPASFDHDALAVCSGAGVAGCFQYESPVDGPSSLRVMVAIPLGLGLVDGEDPLSGLPSVPGGLPVDPVSTSAPLPPVPLPEVPTVPGLPGLPGLPGSSSSPSSSGSSSASSSSVPLPLPSSSSSSSTSSSSTSNAPAESAPRLDVVALPGQLSLASGEEGSVRVTVRNTGAASDIVRLTAQTDAPVGYDTDDGAIEIPAGASHAFDVRVIPSGSGSGTLRFLATGEEAATATDSIGVSIAEAAPVAADIAAALDPTSIVASLRHANAVHLHLQNNGPVTDRVSVRAMADGVQVEDGAFDVDLAPGQSVVRQMLVRPSEPGVVQMVVAITSAQGADLKPALAVEGLAPSGTGSDNDGLPEADADGKGGKGAPGADLLLTGVAVVGLAMLLRRRRI